MTELWLRLHYTVGQSVLCLTVQYTVIICARSLRALGWNEYEYHLAVVIRFPFYNGEALNRRSTHAYPNCS